MKSLIVNHLNAYAQPYHPFKQQIVSLEERSWKKEIGFQAQWTLR